MELYKMDDDNPENMKLILDKYIREKNVPQAIKWHRRLYNTGLREANDAVLALMENKPTYAELEAEVERLNLLLEKAAYEHGLTQKQASDFSGRLGRINRMLDDAGVDTEGRADERVAKLLNVELPDYP